jgi:hypothetical protein
LEPELLVLVLVLVQLRELLERELRPEQLKLMVQVPETDYSEQVQG